MILFLIFRPLKKIIFASGRIIFVTTKTSLSAGVVITEKSLSITDWADLKYAWIIILVGSTFAGAAISYGLVGPLFPDRWTLRDGSVLYQFLVHYRR